MSSANTEVVVAPFNIWRAPVGTAFPDISVSSTELPSVWGRVGKDQSRSMDESGITVSRAAQDGEFRGYGAGRVRKTWTISEDLSFTFMMADFTLETQSLLIEDDQPVLESVAARGAASAAVGSSAGTNYLVGDVLTVSGASGGIKPRVAVTTVNATGGITGVELVFAGRGLNTTLANLATTGGSGNGATVTLTRGATDLPAIKTLTLGRRGARLAKKQFAFIMRGQASPYVDGALAQINVPCAVFEGTRDISFTRNDPIKYSCTLRCIEDSGINGYAEFIAIDV